MFAEELAGNASRKRAEQNRARRRRLKAQQEKKSAAAAAAAAAAEKTAPALNLPKSEPGDAATVNSSDAQATVLTAPKQVAAPSKQLSAVEKAQHQRQIRAETAERQKAAIALQAYYRRHRSNVALHAHHNQLLAKRLQDISTLRNMLATTKQMDYSPPPATTTTLVQQLLFVTTFNHVKRVQPSCSILLKMVLDEAIVPSIVNPDENVNPILVWLQSYEGRRRWEGLLRLALVASVQKNANSDTLKSTVKFLHLVLGDKVPADIRQSSRSLLLPTTFRVIAKSTTTEDPSFAADGSPLSLIAIIRYYFMFVSAGSGPIPPNSMDLRERSIAQVSKDQGGELLTLVFLHAGTAGSSDQKLLFSQMVSHLLTVPLLTWKISSDALQLIIAPGESSSSSPNRLMMALVKSFCDLHAGVLSQGKIDMILSQDDVPLTLCPATASQCLLANLMQLARICPALNGSDTTAMDFEAAADFFSLLAALMDAIPLGTFTSRESAVEWIDDGSGHHKPVVLSPIIIEQCNSVLMDSFVRNVFNCAIDANSLRTDEILAQKDDKDRKHETELSEQGASSAAALAAKEARVDRSKSFWSSSKWARKLSKGVTSFLSGDGSKPPSSSEKSQLLNTSSVSRELAEGAQKNNPSLNVDSSHTDAKRNNYSTDLLFALSKVYAIVLARWGGGGSSDIVQRRPKDRSKGERESATIAAEPCSLSLLNTLCFGTQLVKVLWGIIQSDNSTVRDVYAVIDADKGRVAVRMLRVKPSFTPKQRHDGAAMLFLFVSLLSHVLILTDDVEIHDMDRPLPIHQLRRCIQVLKKLLFRACCTDDRSASLDSNYFGLALISASSRAMRDLYDRSSRRPLCAPKLWIVADLMERDIRQCKTHEDFVALLSFPVLRVCPFLVSFKRRLKLFERIITTSRIQMQGVNDANPFNPNPLKKGIPIRITRGRILEDGLATMNTLGKDLRQRISVNYYNAAGARETGIDAGGLFKEFWTDLCAIAFDPNYALFRVTDGAGNCMYPNPSSSAAHGPDHIILFEFLGRILGKALYEGITIHPRFAHFFLSFLRGDYNFLHMLPDLSTVDPQLYNNLMFLKTYDGDASDLCLTFSVTNDDFGGTREIPLIPNGENTEVTNTNKQRYIGMVAKYYVVDRVKEQSEAFTRGLWEVIDRSWLRIFNEPELQVLISGASDGKLDVDDLRAHTRYAGGFSGLDRTVNRFWKVVAGFNSKQQADLLRFVTSCERPPPLGFSSMNPPFTLQRVGILRDGDKLPTASTCFNILKLPTYSSERVLRERLLYSIEAGAGFELT